MGKDRIGKYHPPKGKPSGAGKEEGLGVHPTDPDKLDQYLDISDKYTTDADTLAPGVPLRHPNRNTEKGQERFKNQQDRQDRKTEGLTFTEESTPVIAEELPASLASETFSELADYNGTHCVSLFIDTHAAGVEVNERYDLITFKNALQDVTTRLSQKGLNKPAIEKLLEPGYELLRNDGFWVKQTPGLAVFIAEGYFKYLKLPFSPQAEMVIENSFYITPLVPLLRNNGHFFVAVISKKQLKLFRADAFGIEHIPVAGLPQGMEDAQAPDKDNETTFRIGGVGGDGAANYHGHGGGNNVDDKAKIATFLETCDDIIWKEILHDETAPLLIAGVEYLIPIYKSVTDYKYVWDDALTGSYEYVESASLHKQAKEKMEPYFKQRETKALELYGNQSATALTSSIPADVIPATYYGRVAHLFVARGHHIWGTFDEMNNELTLHEEQQPESEDLVDHAVVRALLTGGEVHLIEKDKMPADSGLAAIFRY